MKIKICGITDRANMLEIIKLKPDYMGFIFFEASSRDISKKILNLGIESIPGSIVKVAVVVNEKIDRVRELVVNYGFEAVQLHGAEPPEYCTELSELCMVIKAFPVGKRLPGNIASYEGCCDLYLFDKASDRPGGSGEKFNHNLLKDYNGYTPCIISGGISPADADDIKKMAVEEDAVTGVDLNSRFEIAAGYKDVVLLSQFINMIRS